MLWIIILLNIFIPSVSIGSSIELAEALECKKIIDSYSLMYVFKDALTVCENNWERAKQYLMNQTREFIIPDDSFEIYKTLIWYNEKISITKKEIALFKNISQKYTYQSGQLTNTENIYRQLEQIDNLIDKKYKTDQLINFFVFTNKILECCEQDRRLQTSDWFYLDYKCV